MERKTDSLLFKFAIIFVIFTLVTLLMSGFNTYYNQTTAYKEQCEENLKNIAACLEELIVAEGEDFVDFQGYFLSHYKEIKVPLDFDGNYQPEKKKFESLLAAQYPGKTFNVDIKFNELSEEVKLAYTIYKYEYWLNVFEKTRDSFGIKYAYYVTPTSEYLHMYWMIDALREEKVIDGMSCITLCTDVYEEYSEHERMWEAWNTGKSPSGYDVYDNEYGKTYAYYIPLIIDDKKIGVIGTEVEIDNVNKEILDLTIKQSMGMSMVLIVCVLALLAFINKYYISKLSHLQLNVRTYSQVKDPTIASTIEHEATGHDEISALAQQIAAMILELENYMTNLLKTAQELNSTKQHADTMHKLAHKDALTGIMNKTAYDDEIRRIEWQMVDGYTKFGVAMIDLNFLKRINDTFGHEQGNIAIKKLCHIVCNIFEKSLVFRIGGDEFVVILENDDYNNADSLVEKFNATIEEIQKDDSLEQWEKVSASIGVAFYDPITDTSFANVFKRADKLMYIRKKEMKATRID